MRNEYKVGEIFEHDGEVLQCVIDTGEYQPRLCKPYCAFSPPAASCANYACTREERSDGKSVHFTRVTELKEGMLFRAENGKLYRFTTDLKDGEKCSCQTSGYSCSTILRQLCALCPPPLRDRTPREWPHARFVLVDEGREPGGNPDPDVRRHIEIAVDAVKDDRVTFRITEQTRRCGDFAPKGPEFRSSSGYRLISESGPVAGACIDGLFVRGWNRSKDDAEVTAPLDTFAKAMEAVTEYNLTNGTGYEKLWPQKGDFYYFVDSYITVRSLEYFGSEMDHDMQNAGNFFRTCEEAEAALERVKKALRGR